MADDESTVRRRRTDGIGTLTLSNPARLNALSPLMLERIADALDDWHAGSDVRAVVIRGAHGAFSAGADLSALGGSTPAAFGRFDELFHRACRAVREFPAPVIAQIEGHCLGGGLSLALEADVRLAARTSRFGIPAARIGIAYVDVGPLVRAVGYGAAATILFAGDTIDGDEAERIGLVTRAVDEADLVDQVGSLARRIAANAPLSVRASKAALRDLVRRADVSPIVVALAEQCRTSGDLSEGLAAFSERRTPVFRGE
jgi:enoyl-CoA hydratase/carnithine racemase